MDLFSQVENFSTYYRSDKLTVARRAAMLSMEELATKIGKTRQFVCKLEKGCEPTTEVLERICSALGINKGFLYTERCSHVDTEKCHFRSLKTRTKTITLNVKSRVEILSSVLRKLENEIELPCVDLPDVSEFNLTKNSEIERLSESVRHYWKLGVGPISNVSQLIESIGVIIAKTKGTDGKVDAFSVSGARPLMILDNPKASVCRNRFTLAHELGHLLFHEDIVTGDSVTESQADYFASSFLMPRASFVNEFPCSGEGSFNWENMIDFKLRWRVSLKAIIYRATQLGLISTRKAKTAYMHLNTRGFVYKELGDDAVASEEFVILHQMVNLIELSTWRVILAEIGISEKLFFDLFEVKHNNSKLHSRPNLSIVC